MNKGLFITFEGNDGSGKTTISKLAYEKLKAMGYPVLYTREPGGIDIAEQIRSIILDPANTAMDERCEALLYAASRRQHLIEKVLPALKSFSATASWTALWFIRELPEVSVLRRSLLSISSQLKGICRMLRYFFLLILKQDCPASQAVAIRIDWTMKVWSSISWLHRAMS